MRRIAITVLAGLYFGGVSSFAVATEPEVFVVPPPPPMVDEKDAEKAQQSAPPATPNPASNENTRAGSSENPKPDNDNNNTNNTPSAADRATANASASASANPGTRPPVRVQGEPIQGDPDLEPQVTIVERNDETHEEVRVNGVIRYIRVTPKVGPVYYLVPSGTGSGSYIRRDSLDTGLRAPMWELFTW